jgi:hypothetical protein
MAQDSACPATQDDETCDLKPCRPHGCVPTFGFHSASRTHQAASSKPSKHFLAMPDPPQYRLEKPIFQGAQNAFIDCQVDDCDWSFFGKRDTLKAAWNEHYRMNHSQQVGAVLVHKQLREPLWLPTR